MQWFTHDQLNELKEKDGLLLTNVHGQTVAVGLDSEYPDAASFFIFYLYLERQFLKR